ncbi:MAG: hypothetical protein ACREMY_03715, partial [bacterium]
FVGGSRLRHASSGRRTGLWSGSSGWRDLAARLEGQRRLLAASSDNVVAFHATISGEQRTRLRFPRTGDLGFERDEELELYITGGYKELIIRGRNVIPRDTEQIVEAVLCRSRRGACAALSIESCWSIYAAGGAPASWPAARPRGIRRTGQIPRRASLKDTAARPRELVLIVVGTDEDSQ